MKLNSATVQRYARRKANIRFIFTLVVLAYLVALLLMLRAGDERRRTRAAQSSRVLSAPAPLRPENQ